MAHTETMLESKEIFNGRVIRVTVDKVQLEDGTTSTREIVHHHGGACILPVDADGNVKMPFDKALGLVMDGTIKDSKTQVALLKYAQLRDKA